MNFKKLLNRIIITLVLVCSLSSYAQEKRLEQLNTYFNQLYEEDDLNGNILIAEKGKIIFEKHLGIASVQTKDTLTEKSIFELASVSKQFTGAAILKLASQGKLRLTDKITRFIPSFSFYGAITVNDLIRHKSGLPDYMEFMKKEWDTTKIATNSDVIDLFSKKKPKANFQAGEKFEYSNTGYLLLATIIEKASGQSYAQYLKEHIFDPVGMTNTIVHRVFFDDQPIPNLTSGHSFNKRQNKLNVVTKTTRNGLFYFLDGIVGDGMVNTTLEDLLKWDRVLYTNKLFSETEKEYLFSTSQTATGEPVNYGFGWFIEEHPDLGKIVRHSGGWGGYITYIERQLDQDRTIIILLNTSYTSLPNRKRLRKILENEWVTFSRKELKSYSGNYKANDNTKLELIIKGDRLFYNYQETMEIELVPDSKTIFQLDGFRPPVEFVFQINDDNLIESVRMLQKAKGIDEVFKKIK